MYDGITLGSLQEQIKEVIFPTKWISKKNGRHLLIQQELHKFFTDIGCISKPELLFPFYQRYRREGVKHGEYAYREGHIDLYVSHSPFGTIAIEYDSGISLKYKSIEKLFQCPAVICIGIVSGINTSKWDTKKENFKRHHERFRNVFLEYEFFLKNKGLYSKLENLYSKKIWMYVIFQENFYEVNLNLK